LWPIVSLADTTRSYFSFMLAICLQFLRRRRRASSTLCHPPSKGLFFPSFLTSLCQEHPPRCYIIAGHGSKSQSPSASHMWHSTYVICCLAYFIAPVCLIHLQTCSVCGETGASVRVLKVWHQPHSWGH
jgi:hypothetical protein